ncbi:MAG: HDIG domain-containing protein [Alteromonadaceae bacterium]|nr:HDIG domain-containing protein [Alteromonadaceae bacterium]
MRSSLHQTNSKQPQLNPVYGLSRFSGYYFLVGLNAKLDRYKHPYWEILIQDAHETVSVYSRDIEGLIPSLAPYSIIQLECARSRKNGKFFFVCDWIEIANEIPIKHKNIELVPHSTAVNQHDFFTLVEMINSIEIKELRNFINEVLFESKITIPFLRNPASLRFHHNYPGGLLSHSVSVATELSAKFSNSNIERDISIVAALLHDIGKTKTLSESMGRTKLGFLLDHSDLTLEICANALARLDAKLLDTAQHLRHAWTYATPNARYGFKPKTDLAKQLQKVEHDSAKEVSSS